MYVRMYVCTHVYMYKWDFGSAKPVGQKKPVKQVQKRCTWPMVQ